ncbi:MAG: HlyD family efflux transporter periplasmic adaptor subunit [Thermodesulfobacteriota bacterium]|nr:HlyD family efflux transporter periplasmic adaptor subunit [Thermodesulfobacteriota bacterium]
MKGARRLLILLVAVVVVAAVVWGLIPGPVPCDFASVTRGSLTVTLEEDGMTRVIDRYIITAPVAGYMRRMELDPGDAVALGRTLCVLEPLRADALDPRTRAEAKAREAAAQASLDEARQEADAAKAAADYASSQHERAKRLFADDFVSRDALDKTETDLRATKARLKSALFGVKVAAHELEAARAVLRFAARAEAGDKARSVPIPSPVDGCVLKVLRESEGVVARGRELLEIGDPRALEVEVDVLSEDAVRITPGMRVDLLRWGGEGILKARVRTVEPVGVTKVSALGVEEQRVLVIADLTSPHAEWSSLGDGYRVEASFVLWEGKDVLQVSASALFRSRGRWAVFAVKDDTAVLSPVKIGRRSALAAEVLSGLNKGDVVIVHPSDTVARGVRVRARR